MMNTQFFQFKDLTEHYFDFDSGPLDDELYQKCFQVSIVSEEGESKPVLLVDLVDLTEVEDLDTSADCDGSKLGEFCDMLMNDEDCIWYPFLFVEYEDAPGEVRKKLINNIPYMCHTLYGADVTTLIVEEKDHQPGERVFTEYKCKPGCGADVISSDEEIFSVADRYHFEID